MAILICNVLPYIHSSNTLLVLRPSSYHGISLLLLAPLWLCKEGVGRSSRWTTAPVSLIGGNVKLHHLPILGCGNLLFYKRQQTPRYLLESFLNECFSIHFAHHCRIYLPQILLFYFCSRLFSDILLPMELKPPTSWDTWVAQSSVVCVQLEL